MAKCWSDWLTTKHCRMGDSVFRHMAATLWMAVLLTFAPTSLAETTPESELFQLINDRLGYMKEVAAYKWLHQRPIEDLPREAVVIKNAVDAAKRQGLDPETTGAFFQAQIEAAKEIQRYWFNQWTQDKDQPAEAKDLNDELRPALTVLGNALTRSLAAVRIEDTAGAEQRFLTQVEQTGLSMVAKRKLYQALTEIRQTPFEHNLARVLATGVIRIGTTADYAPFSYRDQSDLTGIDIAMAKSLAASLNAEIEWVMTSWPRLMNDLAAGRYDIAMSGISRNTQRQQHAFFSLPYHRGGKTPIVRCGEEARFDSLEKIDHPGTRVVVNPGGTNQRFTQTLSQAPVRVYDDNNTIFTEVAEGRADVMITDAVEVSLQTQLDQRLCAAMPDQTLTFLEKAYLMPQDIVWKEYVDTWLDQALKQGLMDKLKVKFLSPQD